MWRELKLRCNKVNVFFFVLYQIDHNFEPMYVYGMFENSYAVIFVFLVHKYECAYVCIYNCRMRLLKCTNCIYSEAIVQHKPTLITYGCVYVYSSAYGCMHVCEQPLFVITSFATRRTRTLPQPNIAFQNKFKHLQADTHTYIHMSYITYLWTQSTAQLAVSGKSTQISSKLMAFYGLLSSPMLL